MEINNTAEPAKSVTGVGDGTENDQKGTYVPLGDVNSTNPKDHAAETPLETLAASPKEQLVVDVGGSVEITAEDKDAFISALVSGGRFMARRKLFNGKVEVVFRSRSLSETEAILAYMHRNGVSGKFTTTADVQNTSLLALLVAQVASLNGVDYAEMKAPLKYVETVGGVEEPAWVPDMDIWRRKPEALLSALGDALVEFEAKYWAMTKASKDENFWNPDGSTGK